MYEVKVVFRGVVITKRVGGYKSYASAKAAALKSGTADVVKGNRFFAIVKDGKLLWEMDVAKRIAAL